MLLVSAMSVGGASINCASAPRRLRGTSQKAASGSWEGLTFIAIALRMASCALVGSGPWCAALSHAATETRASEFQVVAQDVEQGRFGLGRNFVR